MPDNKVLEDNIAKLNARIQKAAQKNSRSPEEITLLAVGKTSSAKEIRQVFTAGLADIGENYLQEAVQKQELLQDLPICWHFIGPIQSNKTATIASRFDWVHSIDRYKIGRRLSEQRPGELPPLKCCIQVNINGEASKSGVSIEALPELVEQISALPNIQMRGLMAIPKSTPDPQQQRRQFRLLADALKGLQNRWPDLDTLSMGMSSDMDSAIAEGATIVRIGTALFGPRKG